MEIDEVVLKELERVPSKDQEQTPQLTQQEPQSHPKLSPEARLGLLAQAAIDGGQQVMPCILLSLCES